jgi:hypothetical protein
MPFFYRNENFLEFSLKNLHKCRVVFNFASSKQLSGAILGSKDAKIRFNSKLNLPSNNNVR